MGVARNAKKVHQTIVHYKIYNGRPKARWCDGVKNDIRTMKIVNWRKVAQESDWGGVFPAWVVEPQKRKKKKKG